MQKHRRALIFGGILAVIVLIGVVVGILIAQDIAENRRLDATSVVLKNEERFTVPYGAKVKVSDFIEDLNGEIVDDFEITTDSLGVHEIVFEYINAKNHQRKSTFNITVADLPPPLIYGRSNYTVARGYDGDLTNLILSGDNLDDHPTREIIGSYNLNKTGK